MAISASIVTSLSFANIAYGDGDHTFSSVAIGDAASDRIVAVAIYHNLRALSSVTIGGVSATLVRSHEPPTGGLGVALAYASIASGTTADIRVVADQYTWGELAYEVWRITGANSSAYSTAIRANAYVADPQVFVTPPTIPTDGLGLFVAGIEYTDISMTVQNATEDSEGFDSGYNGSNVVTAHSTTAGTWNVGASGQPYGGGELAAITLEPASAPETITMDKWYCHPSLPKRTKTEVVCY